MGQKELIAAISRLVSILPEKKKPNLQKEGDPVME
jgi:exosome complex RNA-binding protein Csl4